MGCGGSRAPPPVVQPAEPPSRDKKQPEKATPNVAPPNTAAVAAYDEYAHLVQERKAAETIAKQDRKKREEEEEQLAKQKEAEERKLLEVKVVAVAEDELQPAEEEVGRRVRFGDAEDEAQQSGAAEANPGEQLDSQAIQSETVVEVSSAEDEDELPLQDGVSPLSGSRSGGSRSATPSQFSTRGGGKNLKRRRGGGGGEREGDHYSPIFPPPTPAQQYAYEKVPDKVYYAPGKLPVAPRREGLDEAGKKRKKGEQNEEGSIPVEQLLDERIELAEDQDKRAEVVDGKIVAVCQKRFACGTQVRSLQSTLIVNALSPKRNNDEVLSPKRQKEVIRAILQPDWEQIASPRQLDPRYLQRLENAKEEAERKAMEEKNKEN
mmetsp:Transcript_24082/g.60658  ORF Transcript_24082/g.60658 Transcript_24082/m.60658 type:complete len:378 (+) Transcript_24082:634-1767(+)|eukprot:g17714.t1